MHNFQGYFLSKMLNNFTAKAPSNMNFLFYILAVSELYFLKPALFTFKDDYYASVKCIRLFPN